MTIIKIKILIKMRVYLHGAVNESGSCYGFVTIDNDKVDKITGILEDKIKGNLEFSMVEKALELSNGDMELFLDSEYVINCLTRWYKGWQKNGWTTAKGMPVKHKLNIEKCLTLMENRNIKFAHIKPFAQDEYKKMAETLVNEYCKKEEKTFLEHLHEPCQLFFPQTNQVFKFNSVYDLQKQANL